MKRRQEQKVVHQQWKKSQCGSERGTYVTDETANTVRGKDIETVVIVQVELELGGKVAHGTSGETEEYGGSYKHAKSFRLDIKKLRIAARSLTSADETRPWGDGHKTANGTRAETNRRPLALEAIILNDQCP